MRGKQLRKTPSQSVLNGSSGLGTFHRNVFSHDICLYEDMSTLRWELPKGLSRKEKIASFLKIPISFRGWEVHDPIPLSSLFGQAETRCFP